jgi:hypothetical protein
LEDLDVDGRIKKIDVTKIGYEGMDWVHVDLDTERGQDILNAVMNLRVLNFLTS